LLCPSERYLMLFPILVPSSLPVVVAQPDERHACRTVLLEWYDKHRAYIWFKRRREEDHKEETPTQVRKSRN